MQEDRTSRERDVSLWRLRARGSDMEWIYTENPALVEEMIGFGWRVQALEVAFEVGLGAVLAVPPSPPQETKETP